MKLVLPTYIWPISRLLSGAPVDLQPEALHAEIAATNEETYAIGNSGGGKKAKYTFTGEIS